MLRKSFFSLLLYPLLAFAAGNDSLAPAHGPDKLPAILPAFDYNGAIEKGLQEHLKPNPGQIVYLQGQIPQDCKDRADQQNHNVSDIEVFEAHFQDCDHPWIMCRLKSAEVNATTMADTFGKMPLGMREYIKHVMVVKPSDLPGAAAVSCGDTILFADTSYRLYIFAHEMSHSLDSHVPIPGITPDAQGGLSISKTWADQFDLDNATISEYARSIWPENLAETGIIALYNAVVPGGAFPLQRGVGSVFHQYATYQTYYRDIITPGRKLNCSHRMPDSPMINFTEDQPGVMWQGNNTRTKIGVTMFRPGIFHNETFILPHTHVHGHGH